MKISIYAPYTKECFETAREHSILHPERIAGNLEVIPKKPALRLNLEDSRTRRYIQTFSEVKRMPTGFAFCI
jgi:hypothetical protein